MKSALAQADHFFVQDDPSMEVLAAHGIRQVSIAGDTRIDRVVALPQADADFSAVEAALKVPVDIVCGSIWPADADIILPVLKNSERTAILAPHEMDATFIKRLEKAFPGECIRFSQLAQSGEKEKARILILDTVGQLSRIYRLGRCAYVGGGFGPGIHNTLEPAAYGIPVIFGPKYRKFPEAVEFTRSGAGRSVRNADAFAAALESFSHPAKREQVRQVLGAFFSMKKGVTDKVSAYIGQHFLQSPTFESTKS
jgi:3-deoxy-D-manno-octulosonic-acid transferase